MMAHMETALENKMNASFEINGTTYYTSPLVLKLIQSIMPAAKRSGDYSAVHAMLALGLATGQIV